MMLPPALDLHAGVVFARVGSRHLTMDIVRPRRPAGSPPLPCILHVHGGGWKVRDRKALLSDLPRVAQLGYITATTTYRLSPETRFPAQIQDVKCAVRFLRANAADIGLDPHRIGAWGYSAGGHLVALLGVCGGVAEFEGDGGWPGVDSRVQAVCNCCGPTDLPTYSPGGHEDDDSYSDHYAALLLGGPVATQQDAARRASPVTYASRSAAPMLTIHGDHDEAVPIEQGRKLHLALSAAGAQSQLIEIPDGRHELSDSLINPLSDAFFERVLKGG